MSLIYKKMKGLRINNNNDGTVTVMKKGDSTYSINKVCKDVWDQINGVRSINDITLDMSYKYNIPASKIKDDIQSLFEEFKKNNLIEEIW